jgi:hypothetical protein
MLCLNRKYNIVSIAGLSLTYLKHYCISTLLTRWVPLVERDLPTLPEHLSSPPNFSRVRVTRSLVLCVCFVYRSLSFSTLPSGHCVVCSFSIYGFVLPLWYHQALLSLIAFNNFEIKFDIDVPCHL